MQVSVAEFLEKVSKLKRTQEKVDALKANDSLVLRIILQGAFDPKVKSLDILLKGFMIFHNQKENKCILIY